MFFFLTIFLSFLSKHSLSVSAAYIPADLMSSDDSPESTARNPAFLTCPRGRRSALIDTRSTSDGGGRGHSFIHKHHRHARRTRPPTSAMSEIQST